MVSTAGLALLCCALCAPLASSSPAQQRGRLLRVPKVYNALITSNEPLLPSRTELATVGQVLYYPPHHATYPASSGPLILPQVAAQPPPLYDPSRPAVPGAPPQPLESLPVPAAGAGGGPPLELSLHEPGATRHAPGPHDEPAPQQQGTPWPVVYASDVQQQQQQLYGSDVQQQQQQLYAGAGQPEHAVQEGQLGVQEDQPLQQQQQQQQSQLPLAHAVQTVERVEQPGQYQPPAAVDIDAVKNNRPQGIPDVPPPPLPVGRGRKAQPQQPPPPGLLPF